MENGINIENGDLTSKRRFAILCILGFILIGVFLFFYFSNNDSKKDILQAQSSGFFEKKVSQEIFANNQKKSEISEQSIKIAKKEDKMNEAGFSQLSPEDPLLRDNVLVKYNKQIDKYPHKIEFGEGIDLIGLDSQGNSLTGMAIAEEGDENLMKKQSINFLEKYNSVLDIDTSQLILNEDNSIGDFETISFKQEYQGVPVYLSQTYLAKSGNKLNLFVSNFLHGINLDVKPKISRNEAVNKAKQYGGLNQNPVKDSELIIYPSLNKEGVKPILAYKIDFPAVEIKSPDLNQEDRFLQPQKEIYYSNHPAERDILVSEGNYISSLRESPEKIGISGNVSFISTYQLSIFVDASNGKIIDMIDKVREESFKGSSFGRVFPDHYLQDKIDVGLPNQYISNSGREIATNLTGNFLFDSFSGGNISARFTGPFVKVVDFGNESREYSFSIDSNKINYFNFAELDNSYKQEATNMFYHSNLIHDFFTNGDYPFNISGLNFQMRAEINDKPVCNAWAGGDTIHFFKAVDGTCESLSLSSDVIYHEYTHNMVFNVAPRLSEVYWGHTGNMNEGYADYFSCSLNDNSCLSDNFFYGYGMKCLRNCDNTKKYPENYGDEPHYAAEIISGSMWDIRKQVGKDTADKLALVALSYDPQTFEELADNFIISDDAIYGNANLSDGTPHGEEICNAFYTNHGIYSDYCFDILPLIGVLNLPEKVEGQRYLNITGVAGGKEFKSWELSYYNGSDWILVRNSTEKIQHGNLVKNFDLTNSYIFEENIFKIKIIGITGTSIQFEKNVGSILIYPISPLSNDIFGKGIVTINATLVSGFNSLKIEYFDESAEINLSNGISFYVDSGGVIGTWNVSSIRDEGFYNLQFSADYRGKILKKRVRVYLDPSLKEGWPVRIPWYGDDNCGPFGDPCYYWGGYLEPEVADLNNDGKKEVIVHSAGNPTQILIFYNNGSLLRRIDTLFDLPGGNLRSMQIFDFDGDGENEIIPGVNYPAYIPFYGFYGALRYLFNRTGITYGELSSLDIDINGFKDLFYGYSSVRGVYLDSLYYDSAEVNKFKSVKGWPKKISSEKCTDSSYYSIDTSSASIGDINNDGFNEIIVLTDILENVEDEKCVKKMSLIAFNKFGNLISGFPAILNINGEYITGPPVIGDINQDKFKEIIFTTWGNMGGLYVFDYTGNELDGWPKKKEFGFYSTPAVFDLDKDGFLEIAASQGAFPFFLHLFDYTGNELDGWPVYMPWNSYRSILGADVDGDNNLDILTTSAGNFGCSDKLSCGGVFAWNKNGTLIPGFPKVTEVDAQYSAIVDDIDNDRMIEIIASSDWDFDEKAKQSKYRGSIYVWDLDVPYNFSNMAWPQFHHDRYNTGCYNCADNVQSSSIQNFGTENIIDNLNLKIEKEVSDSWQDYLQIYNSSVSIPAKGRFDIKRIFNSQNISINEAGNYRVFASFGGKNASYNFRVD